MGTSMTRALPGVLALAATPLLLSAMGCWSEPPCGWDGHIEIGTRYDLQLLERYTAESTMALYDPSLDLSPTGDSCGALDEMSAGATITVQPRGVVNCAAWFGDVVEPSLDLGPRLSLLMNAAPGNQLLTSGRREFGSGCEGGWEFAVHSLSDDPFQSHSPGSVPVLIVYRVFSASPEAVEACAALLGREVPDDGMLYCGDAFVASMSR
jgi:hypothetical protein